jgi:tetratricopeptide (TPR) repeat protein
MNRTMLFMLVIGVLIFAGCRETDENREYYLRGLRAEQNMQYEDAITHYAKALTFDLQDELTWHAKGRCHLLLAMSSYFLFEESENRNLQIEGNLSKAGDCFRRAEQWGYTTSIKTDTLFIKLQEKFSN